MMIAALAGGWPAKNSPTITSVAASARAIRKRLARTRGSLPASGAPPPKNSPRCTSAISATVSTSPTSATGVSAAANCVYGICEKLPIMMFCGLPVMVAVEPTFEAIASASRYGAGRRLSASVRSSTSGDSTRQIASLTRNAENTPATVTTATSSSSGRWARRITQTVATAKKPDRRRFATTIIMPSSSVSVSPLMPRPTSTLAAPKKATKSTPPTS